MRPPVPETLTGGFVLHSPGHLIEAVDVLLGVEVSRQPGVVVPVAHLVFHVAVAVLSRGAWVPNAARIVTALQGGNLAGSSFVNLLEGGPHAGLVSPAESRHDRETFLFCQLAAFQDGTNPRSIDTDRLLDEHVLARFDGGFQLHRPEVRRSRQQDDITGVNHSFVRIETDMFLIFRHRHAFADFGGLDISEPRVETVFEGIGNRVQTGMRVGGERLHGRTRTASAATDETDFEMIAALGMDGRGQLTGQSGCECCSRPLFEEITSSRGLGIGHQSLRGRSFFTDLW